MKKGGVFVKDAPFTARENDLPLLLEPFEGTHVGFFF